MKFGINLKVQIIQKKLMTYEENNGIIRYILLFGGVFLEAAGTRRQQYN